MNKNKLKKLSRDCKKMSRLFFKMSIKWDNLSNSILQQIERNKEIDKKTIDLIKKRIEFIRNKSQGLFK